MSRINNKFISNRITLVIDWKQSLPQIIAAIIGSGLIVTAFSTINSFILKPSIDISSTNDVASPYLYKIFIKNIGYMPATHLRLTIHMPGDLRYNKEYENENMTVENERSTSSMVAFLPRLAPGGSVSIDISNFDSIVATYDQGSSEYRTQSFFGTHFSDFVTDLNAILQPLILILLALLCFGIALRHKRSKSKFASDILADITKVRNALNNDKDDPNGIILRLHDWQSNTDNERQIVNDYRDYQKIDDFYSAVRSRNCYLLQSQVSSDILNILNTDCVDKATIAYTEIDWRKFRKLDVILLIPAIILESLFITTIPIFLLVFLTISTGEVVWVASLLFFIFLPTLRGISSFFMITLTLKAMHGVIFNNYRLPTKFRSYFLFFWVSVAIVGIPYGFYLGLFAFGGAGVFISSFIIDIGTMFLLTWVAWRHYLKAKVKSRRHFLFKKHDQLT